MSKAATEAHIVATLRAVPALAGVRVVKAPAPDDFTEGVTYRELSSFDVKEVGNAIVQRISEYMIVAEKKGQHYDDVRAWHVGIRTIDGSAGANDYGTVLSCIVIGDVDLPARPGSSTVQRTGVKIRLASKESMEPNRALPSNEESTGSEDAPPN